MRGTVCPTKLTRFMHKTLPYMPCDRNMIMNSALLYYINKYKFMVRLIIIDFVSLIEYVPPDLWHVIHTNSNNQ